MQKEELLEILTVEQIKDILIELGAQDIIDETDTKGYLITNTICHNISDGNMKLYYYTETQMFHCYTACGETFSIFDLILKNFALHGEVITFPQSISWICRKLGIKDNYNYKPEGFDHRDKKTNSELEFFKKAKNRKKLVEIPIKFYDDKILSLFSSFHHPAFLEDGISHESMSKYEIKFYEKNNQVIIPHRHWETGKLLGLRSRNFNQNDLEYGSKYIPTKINDITYSYPTMTNLYSLWNNKESIKKARKLFLFEAEKSVMQCEDMFPKGKNLAVALSGSNLSLYQVEIIKKLGIEELVICLDREFIEKDTLLYEKYIEKINSIASKFKNYCQVSYINDRKGLTEYKSSPSDYGKEVFMQLYKERSFIKD